MRNSQQALKLNSGRVGEEWDSIELNADVHPPTFGYSEKLRGTGWDMQQNPRSVKLQTYLASHNYRRPGSDGSESKSGVMPERSWSIKSV